MCFSKIAMLCGRLLILGALLSLNEAAAQSIRANGAWTANDGKSGTWTATFITAGKDLKGEIALGGLDELTRGTVVGSLRGTSVEFGVIHKDREVATFDGGLVDGMLRGTFTTADGITGTWRGALNLPASV